MVFVGFINLGVLFTFVVPKVIRIFDDNKLTLPLSTKILIFINQTVQNYWWLLLIGASFSIWGFLTWKKSPSGRVRWDQLVLKSPVIGPLVKMIAVARFSRTMSTLLKSGVPLLTALDIVKNIVNNAILAAVIENSRDSIREGESIAAPLKRSGQFPPLMYHMIAIGERSGQLEEMLINVASTYESQVEVQVSAMTSLLGPVMIVLMGAIVAFIVISILLPILKLNTMVHG
jgi:general secretion pathway protein F